MQNIRNLDSQGKNRQRDKQRPKLSEHPYKGQQCLRILIFSGVTPFV